MSPSETPRRGEGFYPGDGSGLGPVVCLAGCAVDGLAWGAQLPSDGSEMMEDAASCDAPWSAAVPLRAACSCVVLSNL